MSVIWIRSRLGLVGSVMALTLLASGCGSNGSHDSGSSTATTGQHRTASRVKLYSSLADLASDVQGVAVVSIVRGGSREVPADEAGVGPIPATILTATVQQLLLGQLPAQVDVRMITAGSDSADLPSALKEGSRYVLFLTPFEFHPGQKTGQWAGRVGRRTADRFQPRQRTILVREPKIVRPILTH